MNINQQFSIKRLEIVFQIELVRVIYRIRMLTRSDLLNEP